MSTKRSSKKMRASFIAGTLAAAIALTGTFAWQSISQKTVNEFYTVRNPGARLHDDFNGLNKDVFAENFTEPGSGVPVLVRVRLSEYMETGRDAGVKRNDPSRSVTLGEGLDPANVDINRPETWPIHIPGDAADKFHSAWLWDLGGSTTYMPTFNKNKDSLSVDVNGTYVGVDGSFETGDPYDDYVIYTTDPAKEDAAKKIVHTKTADAYYDADEDDDDDEWVTAGTGGPNGNGGILGTDYTAVQETHEATTTRGATVLTMAEWQAMGSPVGDYWVWDTDGWAYWAAPLMPKEATGALITGVRQATDSTDKCYYAISVEGQFVTKDDIGTEDDQDGFYHGPFSDAAKALVEKIKSVAAGKDGKWYEDLGNNLYQEMDPVTGQRGAKVCAGLDRVIGTSDDKTNIVETDVDVIVPVGSTDTKDNYGRLFLSPDDEFPYYRAMGEDELLGTDDDVRIWYSGTGTFPNGELSLKGAGKVAVSTVDGSAPQVVPSGKLSFKADVFRDEAGTDKGISQEVIWSVTGVSSADTYINDKGELTVASDQATGTNVLTVTARAKADDSVFGTIQVSVLKADEVVVSVSAPADSIKAGDDAGLQLTASVSKGITPVDSPAIGWSVAVKDGLSGVDASTITVTDGLLKVPYTDKTGTVTVTASYKHTPAGGTEQTVTGTRDVKVTAGNMPLVTIHGDTTIQAGQSKDYTITLDVAGLPTTADWTVVSPSGPSFSGSTLTVPDTVKANTEIKIQATATGEGAQSATGEMTVTVSKPTSVTITSSAEKVKKGESITLSATVDGYASQQMRWELSGNAKTTTQLTGTGAKRTLSVDAGETSKTLTVKVYSAVDETLVGTQEITVGGDGVDLGGVTAGSTSTVTIDGIEWYVLNIDSANNKALILSKYILEERQFNTGNSSVNYVHWYDSPLRTYLNGTGSGQWLADKPTLNQYAQNTTITVRTSNTGPETQSSTDKVFLLSEADVFGTEAYGKIKSPAANLYTLGTQTKLTIPDDRVANHTEADGGAADWWWLRSPSGGPYGTIQYMACVGKDGKVGYSNPDGGTGGVRPALWVKIQ